MVRSITLEKPGYAATGKLVISGKSYTFSSSGILVKSPSEKPVVPEPPKETEKPSIPDTEPPKETEKLSVPETSLQKRPRSQVYRKQNRRRRPRSQVFRKQSHPKRRRGQVYRKQNLQKRQRSLNILICFLDLIQELLWNLLVETAVAFQ